MYHFPWIFGLVVVLCAISWSIVPWLFTDNTDELSTKVVIGVLSSRANFKNRQAIRQTWLSKTDRKSYSSIHGWFIVGRQACLVPPDDREDVKSCQQWTPKVSDGVDSEIFSLHTTNHHSKRHQPINEGFAFKVHHPIIINKLGYMDSVMPSKMQIFTVSLKNAISQETIVKTKVSPEKMGVLMHGFRYLPVTPYVLPKGFEASVVIEMPSDDDREIEIHSPFTQQWQDAGGLISFTQVFRSVKKNLSFRFKESDISGTSVGFSIYDKDQLKEHRARNESRLKTWLEHIRREDEELNREVEEYKDVLLVDLIDVYQNLPLKLLLFIDWVTKSYKFNFLLKTDDDCVLDVDKIINELESDKLLADNTWWSRFRYNWLADRVSKWAELDYVAPVYPPFACGMGSILSVDLAQWLASNAQKLHAYQGEDVSLGIWLAAILPKYIDDPRWQCDAGCINNSFNVGQLMPDEIRSAWKALQLCNNFCGC